jgi:hypothetical protein
MASPTPARFVARNLAPTLRDAARHYPVVTLTGPRQAGKTTLCRAAFPGAGYVSLEPLDNRDFARNDPRGFLAAYAAGAIIDSARGGTASEDAVSFPHLRWAADRRSRI